MFTSNEKPPCKGCMEHSAECHSICDRYRKWSDKHKNDAKEFKKYMEACMPVTLFDYNKNWGTRRKKR